MINQIPRSWKFDDSLEMLFLFYQSIDELLSEVSSDSYALPLHNCLTLLYEMAEVYSLIERYGAIDDYYQKYIPPIIDEFLDQTENDYLFKQKLGVRLSTIRTGFKESQTQHKHFVAWVNSVNQICTLRQYLQMYRDELIRLVTTTKDKDKMVYCVSNYFITLRWLGYSREHLYTTSKKFFDNQGRIINNSNQIKDYLDLFPYETKRFDFLILMDIDSIEYMDSISNNLKLSSHIEKIDISKERVNLLKDRTAAKLLKDYDVRVQAAGEHEKMAIVRFFEEDYDPYSAVINFSNYITFLQSFARYFKHFYYSKQLYRILLKLDNGHYREIKMPSKLQKRPYVEQNVIDSRIRNIITANSMAQPAFVAVTQAIEMHAEAFNSRTTTTQLKTFWTALETLFSNPNPDSSRENVVNSVLPIIQKTYILKKLRAMFSQLTDAIQESDLQELGILDFQSFLLYFSSYSANSDEMKKIYKLLSYNPLLRSRLFSLRSMLNSGKTIKRMLERHQTRIEWQLKRLYRIRNIATHLGEEITGTDVAVNHLHNYFDFVVNYILCKSENNDFVISPSVVVFEAKNDNRIYYESLKKDEPLSADNYKKLLFGPDQNLINYQFEH